MESNLYDQGSIPQKKFNGQFLSLLMQEGGTFDKLNMSGDTFTMADYGCATGLNSIAIIQEVLKKLRGDQELSVNMSDLESNNFDLCNKNVKALHEDKRVFLNYIFRSFYEQIYPKKSVDLAICLNSIHWLRGHDWYKDDCLYPQFSKDENLARRVATSAEKDYMDFLKNRETEIKVGGILVLSGMFHDGEGEALISQHAWKVWEETVERHNLGNLKKYLHSGFYRRSMDELLKPFNQNLVKFKLLHLDTIHFSIVSQYKAFVKPLMLPFLQRVLDIHAPVVYPEIDFTLEKKTSFIEEYFDGLEKELERSNFRELEKSKNAFELIAQRTE